MIDQKSVTVIIPHLGATKEQCYSLGQCLESLRETVPSMQIVVVKNGNIACTCRRDIRILQQGQSGAVNAAVATTNTPWIFVTNDDMIYAPGWWERLTDWFNMELYKVEFKIKQEIMCISPKLIEPRPGAPTFEVYFCGGAGGDFDKQKWLELAKNYQGQGIRMGFNLPFLIKRELFNLIDQYDVNYDPWGSNGDSDLEYKIRLAGVQPYQNINSIVYHFGMTSGTSSPDNRPFWDKNWHYFIEKWGFERASTNQGIWEASFEIPEDKLKYKPWWKDFYKK